MKNVMSKKVIAMVLLASVMGTTFVSATEIKKNESVFINLQTNGSLKKTIVSNWIHADESNLEIKDKSELDNIKNVKNDEEPIKNGDNLTWKIEGSDLYYQGTTNKELPLDINIKYYLDGKEIEAKELAGKSGKIKIELEVTNKLYKEVNINGKFRKIYTPFTTAAVVNLPVDKFTSVKTNSGIMLSEGNNNIISFVAFPGLEESLGLDDLDVDIDVELSNKLVIEANVSEFEIGPIMITATPELPDLSELDKVKTINELKDSLNQLKDSSDKLLDGTGQLKDGIELTQTKLIDASKLLNNDKMKEKISLITIDNNVNRANRLIDDAYFAKDIDMTKAKRFLSILSDDNVLKANTLIGDYRAMVMYQDLLDVTLNSFDKLSKDKDFNKLIKDVTETKSRYENIDLETKSKLKSLLSIMTPENLSKSQTLINDSIIVKNDFNEVNKVVNEAIKNTPGENSSEKTINFIKGVNKSLLSTSNLLNNEMSNQLKGLANDVNGYASSYLIIKAQLASTFKAVLEAGGEVAATKAFNDKKSELSQMVDMVYGEQGKEIKEYIESITVTDITSEKIANDSQKIVGYKNSLPGLIAEVDSLKSIKPLIDSANEVLSKQGEAEKVAKLLGNLNDPTTKQLINSLGNEIINLNEDDLRAVGEISDSLNTILSDLETNKGNIEAIEQLLQQLSSDKEISAKLIKFKNDLNDSQSLINEVKEIISGTSSQDIVKVKSLSGRLIEMQQDLKDSEDILRITKDALSKGNVTQARNLISSLPILQDGINKLALGSKELENGMRIFHDNGINRLYEKGNEATDSINDILAVKDELVTASKEFDSFTGKADGIEGSVKFIMKTEEVKMDTKNDETKKEVKKEKKGFLEWLKSLFVREN